MTLDAFSPKQLRETVRAATYPNSQIERETIAAADRAADAVVARHASLLQADAVDRLDNGASLLRIADELEVAMTDDVRVELTHGADPSAMAATYERLEHGVQQMVAVLRQDAAKADLLADRLESPEDDYERIVERLPALRRAIQW